MLGAVDLFRGLRPKEVERIHESGREMRFRAGTDVVTEGGPTGRFFLILEGSARVAVGGDTVNRIGPGDYFGELSLIDGGPRSARVTAETPLRTLSLAEWNFRPLLREHPTIARALLLEMCRRLRRAQQPVD
jgi:CRP-like cAMP-binding protein